MFSNQDVARVRNEIEREREEPSEVLQRPMLERWSDDLVGSTPPTKRPLDRDDDVPPLPKRQMATIGSRPSSPLKMPVLERQNASRRTFFDDEDDGPFYTVPITRKATVGKSPQAASSSADNV